MKLNSEPKIYMSVSFQNLATLTIKIIDFIPSMAGNKLFTYCYVKGKETCIWITPFNKGNLYKIKAVNVDRYYVYYGTFQKIYATTLKDCIDYILKQQPGYAAKK